MDEYPGAGLFQVIRQIGADSGDADPNPNVRLVDPDEFPNMPANVQVIKVSIASTTN